LTWWFWPRGASPTAEAALERRSSLDAFDPELLPNSDWPRPRPKEAVGVLKLDQDAVPPRVEVKGRVISFLDTEDKELCKIDCYPHHHLLGAVLAPAGNRLVVFGEDPGCWAQVWVSDGTSLRPLEAVEVKEGTDGVAGFSPDGTLLAMNIGDRVELWRVRPDGMERLRNVSLSRAQSFTFSADNRRLAVVQADQVSVYDLGPVRPGGGERFRHNLLWAALWFGVVAAVLFAAQVDLYRSYLDVRASAGVAKLGGLVRLVCAVLLGGLVCLVWLCRSYLDVRAPAGVAKLGGLVRLVCAAALLGGLVCLVWWGCLAEPTLQAPSDSALVKTAAKAVTFSPDGQSLAAVLRSGELATFDAATGEQTGLWTLPEKMNRAEFAPDGRHLLGIAARKAYVLRLRALDEEAYILACCEAELKHNLGSADALTARGQVYRRKGQLDRADADFTEVILLDRKNAVAYYQRGLTRADAGDLAGARADFAEAVRLDPKLADPLGSPP
jgi:hypothetical protein